MRPDETTSIRAAKEVVNGIDVLAAATERSRNDLVDEALRQYLDAQAWQLARIEEGRAAARTGRVRSAGEVLTEIAAKHGFGR
jgi:predicted transcriptional regulator